MIRSLDSLAIWLDDFYLLSTVILAITVAVGMTLRQPAKRLAIIKATLVALGILAVLCALPRYSVVHLRTAEQSSSASSAEPQAAAFVAAPNLNENTNSPAATDAAPLPLAKPASDAITVSTVWNEIGWQQVLAMLYVAGAAGVFVWLIIGQLAAIRLRRQAQPAPAELIAMLEEVATRRRFSPTLETCSRISPIEESPWRELETASRRDAATWSSLSETRIDGFGDTSLPRLELRLSARIATPVALGLFRPVILLPKGFADTQSAIRNPNSAIHSILAHELAHIRNHDLAWLAVSRVLLVVLWAQPLYWLVRRRMRFDQETLADAAAAELTNRQQYAEQLVAWARTLATQPLPMRLSPAVGLWEGASQLRQRLAMLLDERFTIVHSLSPHFQFSAFALSLMAGVALSSLTLEPARSQTNANSAAESIEQEKERQTARKPDYEVMGDRFILCRVTTELQRSLLGDVNEPRTSAALCVFVNQAAYKDKEVDSKSPFFVGLPERLTALAREDSRDASFIVLAVPHDARTKRAAEQEYALAKLCEQIGRSSGVEQAKWSVTYDSDFDWSKAIADASSGIKNTESVQENSIGDQRVRVFPVRTFLSRMLANADCVVNVLPILRDTAGTRFPIDFASSIKKYVPELKYDRFKAIVIRTRCSESAKAQTDTWVDDRPTSQAFGKELGFELTKLSRSYTNDADDSEPKKK